MLVYRLPAWDEGACDKEETLRRVAAGGEWTRRARCESGGGRRDDGGGGGGGELGTE